MPRYAHWQTDVQRRAPMRSPWSCAEVNAVVEMIQKGVSTYPFLPTPRCVLTRIAVGMAQQSWLPSGPFKSLRYGASSAFRRLRPRKRH
jgi:hypothetical protein